MALTTCVCPAFKAALLAMTPHTAADTYKFVLIKPGHTGVYDTTLTAGGTPGTGTPSTSNIGTDEVAASGTYSSGGITITALSASLQGTTGCLDFTIPDVTGATISAVGGVIVNSSRSNAVVAIMDFGGTVTSTNSTFACVEPAVGASTSMIRFA